MRQELNDALKAAMKAKDQRKLATLRLILAAIKDRDIAARAEDRMGGVSDEEILGILQKMSKQRDESLRLYEEAGRLDLAEQEREEKEIVESFLPQQMSEDEIKDCCDKVLSDLGAENLKDMGKCMGALKERYTGQMDFSKASAIVRERLQQ
jgi:uncharacterized protein YqeY